MYFSTVAFMTSSFSIPFRMSIALTEVSIFFETISLKMPTVNITEACFSVGEIAKTRNQL